MKFIPLLSLFYFASVPLNAQNYQAFHGSTHAGSLGAAVNPASIASAPYSWDITAFALQVKNSTNMFRVNGISLLAPTGNADVEVLPGKRERYLLSNQDFRLMNARFRINERSALAFGAALRSYQSVKTSSISWHDSIAGVRDFMAANLSNSPVAAEARGMAWAEIFGSYARKVMENDNGMLNAGLTLTVNRGLGAAHLRASGLYYAPGPVHNQPGYLLNNGDIEFAYSDNFDVWDSTGTRKEKRKQFLKRTWSSLSVNIGMEYIIPSEAKEGPYGYDLKIGLSLLDLGFNKFAYSGNSRQAVLNRGNISDSLIQASFENLGSADALPDSVSVIAGSSKNLPGYFKVFQPARMLLHADKRIAGNFFINAELTLALTPLLGDRQVIIRDMNFAALTPRYETGTFGIYLPATLNSRMQFWLGGALRAGPLLLGVHNWSGLFAKNKIQNGGAYLALLFRPGRNSEDIKAVSDNRRTTPGNRGRKGNRFGCPSVVQ